MGSQLWISGWKSWDDSMPTNEQNKQGHKFASECADACQIMQESVEAEGLIVIQHMTISK